MPEEYSDSRRKFIGYAIGGIAGVVTIGYAVPIANYIVRPSLERQEPPWSEVGLVADLIVDTPVSLNFTEREKVGWQEKNEPHNVWVVKNIDGAIAVFSPICPHLGCGYRWDQQKRQFVCPCHLSVYDIHGKVLGGPAPRDLDTLPAKVEDGVLYVKYEKFRLGIATKVVA
jgi:menaquinol-cytochrome c reductase iron-sulfur subunit